MVSSSSVRTNVQALGLALVLMVAGCSGGSQLPDEPAGREASLPTSTARPGSASTLTAAEVEQRAEEVTASPLELLIGLPATPKERLELLTEAEERWLDVVDECVRADGWQYFKEIDRALPTLAELVAASDSYDAALSPSFGYNVSVPLEQSIPHLLGSVVVEESPYALYYNSLNEQELAAYESTLDRCYAHAGETVGRGVRPEQSLSADLMIELTDLALSWREGPEMAELWFDWSTCMARRGYEYRTREDIYRALALEAGSIQADVVAGGTYTPELEARVDALWDEEFRIVGDDQACVDEISFDERHGSIQNSYETAWLEANEDRVALLLGNG